MADECLQAALDAPANEDSGVWGGVSARERRRMRYPRRLTRGPIVAGVEIRCSGCECIVDRGVRTAPCDRPDCCCRDLPTMEAGTESD